LKGNENIQSLLSTSRTDGGVQAWKPGHECSSWLQNLCQTVESSCKFN